jgi:hypothetical protein
VRKIHSTVIPKVRKAQRQNPEFGHKPAKIQKKTWKKYIPIQEEEWGAELD